MRDSLLSTPKGGLSETQLGPHPDLLPRRRPSKHSPRFSKKLIDFSHFESAELRNKDDVVVMKMSKEIRHRSLSFGEGEEGEAGRPGLKQQPKK